MRRIAVLPAPLWPTIATISPSATSREMSRRTDVLPYPAVTSVSASSGSTNAPYAFPR